MTEAEKKVIEYLASKVHEIDFKATEEVLARNIVNLIVKKSQLKPPHGINTLFAIVEPKDDERVITISQHRIAGMYWDYCENGCPHYDRKHCECRIKDYRDCPEWVRLPKVGE